MSVLASDIILENQEVIENGINNEILIYIIILLLGVLVLCSMLNYKK